MVAMGPEGGGWQVSEPLKVRLRFMVLALLAVKPSHGYELSRMIEDITLGTLKAGPGSLYPLLRELASEGLVEEETVVESGRLRKVYRLTEGGWRALAGAIDVARAITGNVMRLLDAAAERLRARGAGGEGCVPGEILEYLSRLEETARQLTVTLRDKACGPPEPRPRRS